jgi:serine protease Do
VGLPDFTKIVSHNGPAVVNVRVVGSTKVAQRQQMPQFDEDDPFFEFFRRFQPQQPAAATVAAGNSFSALDRASS